MYEIESLDHLGRGITKIDNKITFVKNALPGEIVELKIENEKKNYIEAYVDKYIKKSDDRICPKCKYYNDCGGCNIMHLNYNKQLEFKQSKIENIINKYLGSNIKINKIVPSDLEYEYRNKVTFQINNGIGFFENESNKLIEIDNCIISNKLINNSITYLKKLNLKNINKIICRVADNKLMIIVDTNDKNLDTSMLEEISDSIYLKLDDNYINVYGSKYIYESIDNYTYAISPDSFFQINITTCKKLYNRIKENVGKGKNILDLYCGTGSIGIFVSDDNNVIGIEKNKFAILDANKNKKINNLNNINFICGDSGKELKKLNFKPDIVIVDPPRSGLNSETINNILNINPKEIVYVSCDPMTLVRDLKILNKYYDIIEITPFDMFPNTHHIESLVYLKKIV